MTGFTKISVASGATMMMEMNMTMGMCMCTSSVKFHKSQLS